MQKAVSNPDRIVKRLHRAHTAISIALMDAEIGEILARYGYTGARLQEGKELYDRAAALHFELDRRYSQEQQTTREIAHALKQAQASYKRMLTIARVALQDMPEFSVALDLRGTRKRNIIHWLNQASLFYTNAIVTSGVLERMAVFNIQLADLEQGHAEIKAVEALRLGQIQNSNSTRATVNARNYAFAELNRWMQDFMKVARTVFADQPLLFRRLR